MASEFDDETDSILSGLDITPNALGLLSSPNASPFCQPRPLQNNSQSEVSNQFMARTNSASSLMNASSSMSRMATSGSTMRSEHYIASSEEENSGYFAKPLPRSGTCQNRRPQVCTSTSLSSSSPSSNSRIVNKDRQRVDDDRSYRLYTPTVSSAICRRSGVVPRPSPLDIYSEAIDERDIGPSSTVQTSGGQTASSLGMRVRLPEPEVRRESDLDEGVLSEGVITENEYMEDDDDAQKVPLNICLCLQVVASIIASVGKIGLAYYDVDTQIIHLMKDLVDPGDYSSVKKLVSRIGYKTFVTSGKMDQEFLSALRQALKPESDTQSWKGDKVLDIMPNAEFDLEAGKRRVMSHANFLPDHISDTEREIRLQSIIPFQNVCMVRSAGGLIKYLTNKRIGVNLHDEDGSVRVLGYETFSLEDILYVDGESYCSLDIMRAKISHSARYKNKMIYQEDGVSLLGLMNRCRSYVGAKLLRKWFQHPVTVRSTLNERMDTVALLMNRNCLDVVTKIRANIRHVSRVAPLLKKMAQNGIKMREWKCLYNTVSSAHIVATAIRDGELCGGVFTRIHEAFGKEVSRLKRFIDEIIDFETFALKGRFSVRPGLDPDLDEKKRNYYGLPAFMTDIANEELLTLPQEVEECSVNYIPQIGYLLCIPFTRRMKEAGDFDVEGLTLQFTHRQVSHYKNNKMLHLDYALGDLLLDIIDHEMHIMHRLQDSFIAQSSTLHQVVALTAELDCLMAFASCAQEFSWVRPQFVNEEVIHIIDGRHPIMEHRVDQFVSNDYHSSEDDGKVKIITGPNISGKSVYLKQVALIVFMAHLGSFVPAQSAILGPVDNIFTCIWSKESVSTGLSSFMVDINMMFRACREATSRSLVVVDEFGKGTEMTDGLALLAATIKSFVDLGPRSSHTLFSTHFHEIAQQNLLPAGSNLKYQMMNFMEMGDELVLLHKLVDGAATFSYALHVAARMGLDPAIIARAKEVTERLLNHECLWDEETEYEKQRYEEAKIVCDAFLALDLEAEDTSEIEKFLEMLHEPKSLVELYTTPEGSQDSDYIQ